MKGWVRVPLEFLILLVYFPSSVNPPPIISQKTQPKPQPPVGGDDDGERWLANELMIYVFHLIESVCVCAYGFLSLIINSEEVVDGLGKMKGWELYYYLLIENYNKKIKLIEKEKHKGIMIISNLAQTKFATKLF